MTRLERLKREAREIASGLGHRLGIFRPMVITADPPDPSHRPAAVAACDICGALAIVDPASLVEGQAMSGEGVLFRCSAIEQEGHESA